VASGGTAIAVELWSVPAVGLVEPIICEEQREISTHGGWRTYVTDHAMPPHRRL